MPGSSEGIARKTAFYAVILIAGLFHFALTFVVVLFVLSSLSILNDNFLHIANAQYFERAAAAGISVISVIVYIRSFGRTKQYIKNTLFRGSL